MQRLLFVVVGVCISADLCAATTLRVEPDGSGDYPTIQSAVDAAVDSDIVELGEGTFLGSGNRDIDLLGKPITVRSVSGDPASVTIDCQGTSGTPRRGFIFQTGEGPGTQLIGVTIVNGHANGSGGAILCDASPTIADCILAESKADRGGGISIAGNPRLERSVIRNNVASPHGGGIYCTSGSAPVFAQSEIASNTATDNGGGMYCNSASPTFYDCSFRANSANAGGAMLNRGTLAPVFEACQFLANDAIAYGGGPYCESEDPPRFTDCTIAGNTAGTWGGGLVSRFGCSPLLETTTFFGNSAPTGGGIYCWDPAAISLDRTIIAFSEQGEAVSCSGCRLTCSDVFGNAGGDWTGDIASQLGLNGNIREDPAFCNPQSGDFGLDASSPCAPFSPPNLECDRIGAWDVSCGPSPAERKSWGSLKVLFR